MHVHVLELLRCCREQAVVLTAKLPPREVPGAPGSTSCNTVELQATSSSSKLVFEQSVGTCTAQTERVPDLDMICCQETAGKNTER